MMLRSAPAHPRNFSSRPLGARIRALVYHDTQGTAASAVAWFQDPAAGVSAHYIVGVDGVIYVCVPEDRKAWHAGSSIFLNEPNLNDWSLGIEIEDKDDRLPYPAAQLDALLALAADLCRRYAIPLNHIIGHQHIAVPKGRKRDPGPDFPWQEHLIALGARLAEKAGARESGHEHDAGR